MNIVFDEYETRKLPPRERFEVVTYHLKNDKDESIRWDSVWLAGEIANEVGNELFPEYFESMKKEIADLMVWVLNNDNNSIVRHEAAFQIGLHNFRDKIPDLVHSIMNDKSDLVKHEAIEALGLLRDQQCRETLKDMLEDPSEAVRETALFVIKRLERLKNSGEYQGEAII